MTPSLTRVATDDVESQVLYYQDALSFAPVLDQAGAAEYFLLAGRRPKGSESPYSPHRRAVIRRDDQFIEILGDRYLDEETGGPGDVVVPAAEIRSPTPRASVSRFTEVNRQSIHVRAWPVDKPAAKVYVIPGARANTHWFDRMMDFADPELECHAIDPSGHGDSSHASAYSPERWADEIRGALLADATEPATLVGHSMGGRLAIIAAARYPKLVKQVVIVDTPIAPVVYQRKFTTGPRKVFSDLNSAAERFVLLPPQPWPQGADLRNLAHQSLRPEGDGWVWKFDPHTLRVLSDESLAAYLPALACPVHVIRAGQSDLATDGDAALLHALTGQSTTDTLFPTAFHHVPLDSAARLARALYELDTVGRSQGSSVFGATDQTVPRPQGAL